MKKIMLAIAMSLFTIGCSPSENREIKDRIGMYLGDTEKKRDSLTNVVEGFVYIDSIGWVKPESNND